MTQVVNLVEIEPDGTSQSQAIQGIWGAYSVDGELAITGDLSVSGFEVVRSGRIINVFLKVSGTSGTVELPTKCLIDTALTAHNCTAWIEVDSDYNGVVNISNISGTGIVSGIYILVED